MFHETDKPFVADRPEEVSDIEIHNPVHLFPLNANNQRIQCIMLAALWPETVREAQKVFLVDSVEHRHDCTLDNLVLQCGDAQRPLRPIRLGYVLAPARLCTVRAPVDSQRTCTTYSLPVLPAHLKNSVSTDIEKNSAVIGRLSRSMLGVHK